MDTPERDPRNPTPEELRETAASEGLMATEEETDPDFVEEDDASPQSGSFGLGDVATEE